jgi:hypothetical protein
MVNTAEIERKKEDDDDDDDESVVEIWFMRKMV